jgi:hypothetical protein
MSYTIKLSNAQDLVIGGLSDGAVDQSATSLTLVGKNYAGYGEFINENFVYLLENFANNNSPPNPLKGQLWWDTTNNILKVYSGISWKISTGATSSPTSSPPGDLSALGGDLWFDSTTQQLKIYSGASWIVVGPFATPATGDTGAFPAIMTDTLGSSHIVTQIKIVGVTYMIISKDTFNSSLAGFSTVKAGINFSTIASPTMGINTQDINPTGSTLVQRDPAGTINATSLNASSAVNAPTINATLLNGQLTGNVIGNVSATTVSATTVSTTGEIYAGSGFRGTIINASQPNITATGVLSGLSVAGTTTLVGTTTLNGMSVGSLGTVTAGTWQGNIVRGTYGGTGVNNGTNTLTFTSSFTLNQSVASGASPSFVGTNFSGIPNSALNNSSITIGGVPVPLGGTYSAPLNVSSIAGTANQINASASTGAVTLSLPQAIAPGSGVQFGAIGVGTGPGSYGQIRATDNIIAFVASDKKFKENVRVIPNALDTVEAIGGKLFDWTDEYCEAKGGVDGYFVTKADFGVIAQDVKAAFPIATRTRADGSLAVDYEKLSALAFAAIVELRAEIADLKTKIK